MDLQENLFLANHTKTIIVMLVVKQITYVVKVLSIRTSWFFYESYANSSNWQKEKPTRKGES